MKTGTTRSGKLGRLGLIAAVLLLALLISYDTGWEGLFPSIKPAPNRAPAPAFTLQDAKGTNVSLADFKGKVVLLNFWATWCGPCKVEIPWFEEFQTKYANQGFAVVGVSMDDDGWKSVKPFMEARNINYPIVLGNEAVSQAYGGIDSLPTTLLIDREGRIAAQHHGLAGKSTYEDEILKLLK
jgi:peroxiredoxin